MTRRAVIIGISVRLGTSSGWARRGARRRPPRSDHSGRWVIADTGALRAGSGGQTGIEHRSRTLDFPTPIAGRLRTSGTITIESNATGHPATDNALAIAVF